jgi:hypothetical protein
MAALIGTVGTTVVTRTGYGRGVVRKAGVPC